ncbi:MAG TPA: FG-GAP-like repeat-containing protein [Archangium sp.]|uniref:FG-GAP-like repeat-containing protein n=1 Tax=Archangium sp. TaxID=1872627 RepID=UPI002E37B236|nr:FG-GAP-like repeat-containing protein [Archangium sp.]HEX5754585.1 FG-GAP-like repeat-containing protein [Archangium sp.]
MSQRRSRRLIPLFLALLVGAGGCELEPITTQPPDPPPPVTEPPTKPTVPSAPGPVEAHAEPGAVTLSWSPPEKDGGSALTGYQVSAEPPEAILTVTADGTTARVTGLRAGATYRFSVAAVNAVGRGLASRSESVTLPDVPGAPPRPSVVRGDGQVRVSWTEPGSDGGSPLTGYLVTAQPQGVRVTADASARSVVVGGLSNGEPSTFTVRALNAVGEGPDSPTSAYVVPATVPSAPVSVEVTPGLRHVTITWSVPPSTGGMPVDAYVVTLEPDGVPLQVGAEIREVLYSGLEDDTAYAFSVAARNEVGVGPKLLSASVRTPGVPSPPRALSVTAGTRSATVTWEPPAEDGGRRLTGYVVEVSPSGARMTLDASKRGATFTDLSSTQDHTFTVSATNAVGSGPSASSATVRPRPAPVEVTDLEWVGSNAGCLTVSYVLRQPDGVRAEVSVEVDATGSGTFARATQASSTTHEGLLARPTSPGGSTHQFLWDRGFDVPGAATVRVRLSARVPGTPPGSATLERTLPAAARPCEVRLPTHSVQPLNTTALRGMKGDFNGDGHLDLVVAPDSNDTVSLLLGLGNGSFEPPLRQTLRYNLNRLATGDLNGDGVEDLVWPDGFGNLWVARSQGSGFADPVSYRMSYADLSTTPDDSLVLADFDGNGSLDVATIGGSSSAPSLGILANAGEGTLGGFVGKLSVTTDTRLAAADLDEDGRKDLLAIGRGWMGSAALLSNGDGTFRTRNITTPEADTLRVDDLDGDGHQDLVLVRKDTSKEVQVHLLRGDGQGGFSAAVRVDTLLDTSGTSTGLGLAAMDLDRDGLKDLVVTLEWKDALAVLRGKGAGSFEPAVLLPAGRGPVSLITGDFDGDGLEDMASVQNHSEDVRVWRNGPESLSLGEAPGGALARGDFNGDGKMDLVSTPVADSVQVHLAGGPEGLRAQTPVPVGGPVWSLTVGHVDGDAALDVVVRRGTGGAMKLGLLLGNGDGTLRPAADIPVGANPSHVALGDVNGDGRTDLVCQVSYQPEPGYSTQEVRLLLGQGDGTFAAPTVVTTSPNPDALALGDLDKDGALDLVVLQDSPGGGVLLLKGRGDGTFLPPIDVSTSGTGQYGGQLVLVDMNGDGFLDIVRSNSHDNSVHVLTGWGRWMGWSGRSYPAGGNCFSVAVLDFDGDGERDVLCANPGMDSVSLMRGDTYGWLAAPRIFGVRNGAHELAVFDVNADGRPDILTGAPLYAQGTLLLQR